MKTTLKILISVLLLFNSAGAFYGGWNLMIQPDGSTMQMSLDWLQYSPFPDYLIPGIILFIVNGLFGLFVFGTILLRHKLYPWFVIAQGLILTGWIVIQMLMVRSVVGIQVLFGSIGLLLILLGWALIRTNKVRKVSA
ncbi:MAG: hypothetical protein IH597_02835 [Bacteroidales bacterium]|nr:hypothetical protein [Bacteroidales bacterium]